MRVGRTPPREGRMRRTALPAGLLLFAILAAVLVAVSCTSEVAESDLDLAVEWMSGSFSSAAQAEADTSYYDIRLEMVPIWVDRTGACWLYVEQAAATSLDQPYRQRVYHVTSLPDGGFRSTVFSIPDPLRFAGAWRDPATLDALTKLDLPAGVDIEIKV